MINTWRIGPANYDLNRAHLEITHANKSLGLRPLSPCHLRAKRDSGNVSFTWIRRTRVDGDSWDFNEVPLAEDGEAYSVEIHEGGLLKRSKLTFTPSCVYGAAEIAADFGSDPGAFSLRISQMSNVFGPGFPLERTIHV